MTDDQSPHVPASFRALHVDGRDRLTLPLAELRDRHELCEDLAQSLVDRVRGLTHELGVDEDSVLDRIARGLGDAASGLTPPEAGWVRTRLGELLGRPAAG